MKQELDESKHAGAEDQLVGDEDQSDMPQASAETAEGEGGDEPQAKKRKLGKAQRKQSLLKGYDAEKASFSTIATSLTGMESRPITALDDAIAALRFAMGMLIKDKVIESEDDEKVTATFSFCMGLFLEFSWNGKCSLNGREHRQYSHLRTELQQTLIDVLQQLESPEFAADGDKANKAGDAKSGKSCKNSSVTPLELAEILCTTFGDRPVTQVVWDDLDEVPIRNIVEWMSTKKSEVSCISAFVGTMHRPMMLHSAVKESLEDIFAMQSPASILDVISLAYDKICKHLPPAWLGFGFDCVTAFADRGHFVEGTDKARETRNCSQQV